MRQLGVTSFANQRAVKRVIEMKRILLWSSSVALLSIFLTSAIVIPPANVSASDQEARFPQLKMEDLTGEQRSLAEQIVKVSSRGITGPYNSMLRSPAMGERLFMLLDYVRFHTSVPRRLNEFAILIQARLWTSQVEWTAHYPLALKAGLAQSVADDLKVGNRPASMQPDEAVVYDLCNELSTKHKVSDATFKRARAIFSDQQLVDLAAVSGAYVTTAMLLKTANEEGATPGEAPPLQPLPDK